MFYEPLVSFPGLEGYAVSRVVGLPGEMISLHSGEIWIDGARPIRPPELESIEYWTVTPQIPKVDYPFLIPPDSVFVIGDNSKKPFDSRFGGAACISNIHGRVIEF